jgi:hypothetical protein
MTRKKAACTLSSVITVAFLIFSLSSLHSCSEMADTMMESGSPFPEFDAPSLLPLEHNASLYYKTSLFNEDTLYYSGEERLDYIMHLNREDTVGEVGYDWLMENIFRFYFKFESADKGKVLERDYNADTAGIYILEQDSMGMLTGQRNLWLPLAPENLFSWNSGASQMKWIDSINTYSSLSFYQSWYLLEEEETKGEFQDIVCIQETQDSLETMYFLKRGIGIIAMHRYVQNRLTQFMELIEISSGQFDSEDFYIP